MSRQEIAMPGKDKMQMMIKQLMKMIAQTREEEIDCEQVYNVIDVYAESVARGEDPSELLPLVKQHLEICKPCLEEYEALLRILEPSSASEA